MILKLFGSGAYHAAVEIEDLDGVEFSYGYTEDGGTGVFGIPAKTCAAHRYRETIEKSTFKSTEEINELLDEMSDLWLGQDYDLLKHNCCHFSDELLKSLAAGSLPSWVLSLAGVGEGLAGHIDEHFEMGREMRNAPPTGSYRTSDYVRGRIAKLVVRGKAARGASPTLDDGFHFTDFARGVIAPSPKTESNLPIVVWIDFKGDEAFEKSGLKTEKGICFRGFTANPKSDDYEGPAKWLEFITDKAAESDRLRVVILNKNQLQQIVPVVREAAEETGSEPPTFVLVQRTVTGSFSDEEIGKFGIDPKFITNDWAKARKLALDCIMSRSWSVTSWRTISNASGSKESSGSDGLARPSNS